MTTSLFTYPDGQELVQLDAPTTTLVTLAELKAHLGIEYSTDDDRLTNMLYSARDLIEAETDLCITNQTWQQSIPYFKTPTELGKYPIQEVTVVYYDADNAQQGFTEYYLVQVGKHYRLTPTSSWPTTYARPDAITITMTCGMDSSGSASPSLYVPPLAKQACLMLCAAWNEVREAEIVGTISTETKLGLDRLLRPLRRGTIC